MQLPEKVVARVFTPPENLKEKYKDYLKIIPFQKDIKDSIYAGYTKIEQLIKPSKIKDLDAKGYEFGFNLLNQIACFDANGDPVCDEWTNEEKLFLFACFQDLIFADEDEEYYE